MTRDNVLGYQPVVLNMENVLPQWEKFRQVLSLITHTEKVNLQ
jgi:hypothetical protein